MLFSFPCPLLLTLTRSYLLPVLVFKIVPLSPLLHSPFHCLHWSPSNITVQDQHCSSLCRCPLWLPCAYRRKSVLLTMAFQLLLAPTPPLNLPHVCLSMLVAVCCNTACCGLFKLLTLCPKHQSFSFFHVFMHAGLYLPVLLYFPGCALENHMQLSRHFWGSFSDFFAFFPAWSLLYVYMYPGETCVCVCVYILYCTWLLTCLLFPLDFRDYHLFLVTSTIFGMWKAFKEWLLSE